MPVKVMRRVRVQYSSERDFSKRFGYQWWNGSPYVYGQAPPNYPMPAIPIDVDYDMVAEGHEGYWDLWIGHDPCAHVEYFCKR